MYAKFHQDMLTVTLTTPATQSIHFLFQPRKPMHHILNESQFDNCASNRIPVLQFVQHRQK